MRLCVYAPMRIKALVHLYYGTAVLEYICIIVHLYYSTFVLLCAYAHRVPMPLCG
jgi:hypothetical protein